MTEKYFTPRSILSLICPFVQTAYVIPCVTITDAFLKPSLLSPHLFPKDSCDITTATPPTCSEDTLKVAQHDCDLILEYESECPGASSHYHTCVNSICDCPSGGSLTECSCKVLAGFFASKCLSDVNWLPQSVCSHECEYN